MPSWGEVLEEISRYSNPFDVTRRKYLSIMHETTGRNVIAYYSCFLQRPNANNTSINDQPRSAAEHFTTTVIQQKERAVEENKTKEDFVRDFAEMGLTAPPVPEHYDPETYGRNLMRSLPQRTGVSYDISTRSDKTACGYIGSQFSVRDL